MPGARCPVPGAQCPVLPGVRCSMPSAVCPVPCDQCPMCPNAQCPIDCSPVRCSAARPGACHPYERETADLCDGRARVAAVRLSLPASRLKKAARAACLAVSPCARSGGFCGCGDWRVVQVASEERPLSPANAETSSLTLSVSCLGSPSVSVLFDRYIHRAMLQTPRSLAVGVCSCLSLK